MSQLQESLEAAISNAANRIAKAETVEEAQQWQSVISNLVSAQSQVGDTSVPKSQPSSSFEEVAANADNTEELQSNDN